MVKLVFGICLFFSYVYIFHAERYVPFNPHIDTILPAEFSEKEFAALKKGSSQSEVLNLLGEPTEQNTNRNGTIDWYYGTDNAAAFGDFAWVQYLITFDEKGRLFDKSRTIIHD